MAFIDYTCITPVGECKGLLLKETKSATMNIFQKKYYLFKSFVKAELS